MPVLPRVGTTLDCLLGIADHSDDFDHFMHAIALNSPETFDPLLHFAEYASSLPTRPLYSPWVSRALTSHTYDVSVTKKYKPMHHKVHPVPTYMPNPNSICFKPIEFESPTALPTHLRPLAEFVPTDRLTLEHLKWIVSTIPTGFLSSQEVDLLVSVLDRHQSSLAFTDNERGILSRAYFPDYQIPMIKHVPWA